ncbi:MAG TPA: hypothetical protein VHG08_08260 [Longimicrobium sp.]|nr:hypothetical protein [Longimicrobium sp.]
MWMELFAAAALLCVCEIVFGRFEERARIRRVAKLIVFLGVTALLSRFAGRGAALGWVFGALGLSLCLHLWWTRRNGIEFFSPEPWDHYRALRGWS